MSLDALLYEIYIRTKGVPTKHVPKGGWETYGDVMEMLRDTKPTRSNGRKKISKQALAISSYAQKIVPLINARPRYIRLDRLLYTIYVQAEIAESERDIQAGRFVPHEQVKTISKLSKQDYKRL
jgi:hypothetical protein